MEFNAALYLSDSLHPKNIKRYVACLIKDIKDKEIDFDAIVCCGVSGAAVAPIVAYKLDKPLIFIRKREKTHSTNQYEGVLTKKYIIIDDMVEFGVTINRIKREVEETVLKYGKEKPECTAVFLYNPYNNQGIDFNDNLERIESLINDTPVHFSCPIYDKLGNKI